MDVVYPLYPELVEGLTFRQRESTFRLSICPEEVEGMTIYQVRRETDTWQPVGIQRLGDGHHIIEQGGISVPVTISEEGKKVVIHLDQAEGDLTRATIDGMGDDWTIADRGSLVDVTVKPELYPAGGALHIFSDSEKGLPALILERHDQAPTFADFGRRK